MPISNFANQITWSGLLLYLHILNGKQCSSRSVGFFRSLLIWIYTVCKGRVYPGSAGQELRHSKPAIIYLTPTTCVNIMRKFIYLFPHCMISNTKWEWMNEWMNERKNKRGASERGNEWMSERASERMSKRGREGGSVWSDWFRERVNEFINGYKVDFSKFKQCSTFNYYTAIQTKIVKIGFDWNQCKLLHK